MSSPLSFWMLTVGLYCGVCRLAAGFQWQNKETLIVNGCVGSRSTIPWKFFTDRRESVGTIHWFRFSKQTVASFVDGKITNPDKRFTPSGSNAELSIAGLTVRDTGHYEVHVKIFSKNQKGEQIEKVYTASAILSVGDPPSVSGETLTVQEVTSNEVCALQRQTTLRCGRFTTCGVPPVDVVWTDPAGQQLPSSRYADGMFDLDLPLRPLAGNYTCHVRCQNPVLQCLQGAHSPLLTSPRILLRPPPSVDGCSEADRRKDEELPSAPVPVSQTVQRLESNLTELRQDLITLQQKQTEMKKEKEDVKETFLIKVEELREMVLLSSQQSGGAQVHVLQQTLQTVQNTLHDVQRNMTALQKENDDQKDKEQRAQELHDHSQDVLNTLKDLSIKLQSHDQTLTSLRSKVAALSAAVSQNHNLFTSLQNSLAKTPSPLPPPQLISEEHVQNFTDLWQSLNHLQDLHDDISQELREVHEVQMTCETLRENVTRTLGAMSSRVEGVEEGLSRRVDRVVSQCDVTQSQLSRLNRRVDMVESGRGGGGGGGGGGGVPIASAGGEERMLEPDIDPLVSKAEPTFSLTSPWDGQRHSLFHDFVITPDGQVVIADQYNAYIIIAPNASSSDVTTLPLRHGRHIRKLTHMQDGVVAATVDDRYILILDTSTADPDAQQRWIRTSRPYHGIAARSAQTLFVGVDSESEDSGVARVDIISIVDDAAAVVNTVLNGMVTSELKKPAWMTLHDDELYVSDWDSGVIIRLSLQSLQVAVLSRPEARQQQQQQPPTKEEELTRFFQPRKTAFDVSGNMYVTTGGKLCGVGSGEHVYSRGFCVVVVSQEGLWERLVYRGLHAYPYGMSLTSSGLAVSWGSFAGGPVRSLIQWYDLVQPNV